MPQWLLYELHEPKSICRFIFSARDNSYSYTDCPKSFRFEGSNDGEKFTTLFLVSLEETCTPKMSLVHSFINRESYKYYRFMVLDVPGRANGHKFVVIGNVKFFGHKVGESRNHFSLNLLIFIHIIVPFLTA